MKLKKIFALALAVCMMLSVMPTTYAGEGYLSLGNDSGSSEGGVLTSGEGVLTNGTTTQPRQTGVLTLNNGTGSEGDGITPVADPVVDNSGALDKGENVKSGAVFTTLTNNSTPSTGSSDLTTSSTNGLELKKTVSEAGDKITLEAWVTGQTVTITQTTTKPMDIILVLDTSSEMIDGNDKTTRLNALKTAATTFINNVAEQTVAQGEQPTRIAIVKYNDTASVESGTKLAEEGALVFVNASGADELNGIIDALTVKESGAANCNLGLAHAKNIFQSANNGQYKDRDRVVILLSAGVFGSSGNLNTTDDYIVAMDTIWLSSILKLPKQYNVIDDANTPVRTGKHSQNVYEITPSGSTYTYGIDFNSRYYRDSLEAAHTESQFTTLYCNGSNNSGYDGCGATVYCIGLNMPTYRSAGDTAARINEVMYRVCSHRPDGTHVESGTNYNSWETAESISGWYGWVQRYTDERTRDHENGYFLTADNAAKLNDIFESISSNVTTGGSSNESLTTETVVQDVISPYFQIPADGTVTAYSVAYNGNDTWGEKVKDYTPTLIDGNTVTVEGFNFSDNWVGTADKKPHGQKLVIEIDIAPKTGFLGGQGIPTNNNTQAGVYLNGTLVENFPATDATTDISIPAVTVDVKDKNVYLSNEMSEADMLSDAVVKIGDVELDLKKENFGLEEWQYAFLSEIKVVANEGDSTFETSCTVKDKAGNEKSNTDSADINVFKPVLTFKDSTIYLGEKADYTDNYGTTLVDWTSDDVSYTKVTMTGAKPSVDVEYSPVAGYFTECEDVSVTSVKLNGSDDYVDDTTVKNGDKDYFTVHVVKPVVEFQDSTIYLGYEPTQDDFETYNIEGEVVWTHTKEDGTAQASGTKPAVSFAFDKGDADYTDCTPVSATVYSGGIKSHDGNFTVHVLKPTITFVDQEIYLSQTLEYAAPTFAWDQTCSGEHTNIPTVSGTDTQNEFVYDYDKVPAAFVECTDVDVAVKIGTTDYSEYVTLKNGEEIRGADVEEFTVHVYLPKLVLESQNLWADYDCNVTLTDGMKAPTIDKWADQCKSGADKNHSNAAPQCSVPVYAFKLGEEVITSYNAKNEGVTDQSTIDVELTKIKIGDTEYSFSNVEAVKYTITVNKFDLTINKEWDGAAIYKQDAIFTVAGPLGNVQVVLPANQPNIEITGLLCGQEYKVEEQTAWTWRWSAKQTDGIDSHSHSVSTEAPTEHTDTSVTFENTLINRLWLSFCTFVRNIFGQDAIQKGGNV